MKNNKGITLVALIVTIIILIILAGISINMLMGTDGLITKAKQAKENIQLAEIEEQTRLNELYNNLSDEDISSFSYDALVSLSNFRKKIADAITEAGVATSENDSDNKMAENIGKIVSANANVNYITLSDGTVPVPKSFYYVGGNLATGVIISDNSADQYDGVTDKTTFAYTTSLVGNQFVWIPCATSQYVKTDWESMGPNIVRNAQWDTTIPKAEILQIEKYGGFYVARYEAGIASDMSEYTTTQKNTYSNQVYNVYKIPQSKAGVVPWNFIDWTHAKSNAENMKNDNYVSSGLITGTQWDVILDTLVSKTNLTNADIINSTSWGNFRDTSIPYTGRKATSYVSSGYWYLPAFGNVETSTTTSYSDNHGDLLTTGASPVTEKYHIFDIAGNVWEMTEETALYSTEDQNHMHRSGGFNNPAAGYPACVRYTANSSYSGNNCTRENIGYRVVLYIK